MYGNVEGHLLKLSFLKNQANYYKVVGSSLTFTAIVLALGFAMFRSMYSPPPIELKDISLSMSPRVMGDGIELTTVRKYVGSRTEVLTMDKILYKESDPENRIAVESGGFTSVVGEFKVVDTIILPATVRGRWCLRSSISWWPSVSQVDFEMALPDVCFEAHENG